MFHLTDDVLLLK